MNPKAIARFRRKLKADEPLFGLSITLEAPAISDIAAAMGLDWIELDVDRFSVMEIKEHARAALRSHTVVLFRVASTRADSIDRWVDFGADGILLTHEAEDSFFDPDTELRLREERSDDRLAKPLIVPVSKGRSDATLQAWLGSVSTDAVFLETDSEGETLDRLIAQTRAAGKQMGILAQSELELGRRVQQGFRLLSLGADRAILRAEIAKAYSVDEAI